jgi:hypothetical protein
MDKTFPFCGIIRSSNFAVFGWFVGAEAHPFSMVRPYRKRRGLGKCEANRILINWGLGRCDSGDLTKVQIDKTFVIQNLFRRVVKSGLF